MEIAFAADHTAVKKRGISMLVKYTPRYFMKFDVGSEISFTFKKSIDKFLSCFYGI